MTDVVTLAADMRDRVGKGTAHALRRQGKIPAVIYGDKQAPLSISMDWNVAERYANQAGFFTHLFDIEIAGKKHRVLPRDAQFDPVSDRPVHIDFLRVSASTLVRVEVPVHFINADKSPGIKRGGTLNIVYHSIEVQCSPSAIPEAFNVDLDGLALGAAIHLGAIALPAGVKPTATDKGMTIASIAVPSAIRSEAAEAAAAAAATPADAAAATPAGAAAPAAGAAAAAPAANKAAAGAKAAGGKK